MTRQAMYLRMVVASFARRKSRMLVALLAVVVGATVLSGLVTIYYDMPRQMGMQFRSYGANMILVPRSAAEGGMSEADIESALAHIDESEQRHGDIRYYRRNGKMQYPSVHHFLCVTLSIHYFHDAKLHHFFHLCKRMSLFHQSFLLFYPCHTL